MIIFTKTPDFLAEVKTGMPAMAQTHYHSSYELYYLEAGNRDYLVEDKLFNISAGDFVLIKPNVLHRTTGGYSLRTLINFSSDFFNQTFTPKAAKHLLKCFDNIIITPPVEMLDELKSILITLTTISNPIDLANNLGTLLDKLSKCASDHNYDNRISSIIKHINLNYTEINSIEEISEALHISKYYLCRIFKEATGTTLIEYINIVKVKNACKFLEITDKDMVEIAEICGFNSASYFGSVFKKIMHDSPLEYRQKTQKGSNH